MRSQEMLCDNLLLQKCDSLICYKLRQLVVTKVRQVLLQSATVLLPSATGITKCDRTIPLFLYPFKRCFNYKTYSIQTTVRIK